MISGAQQCFRKIDLDLGTCLVGAKRWPGCAEAASGCRSRQRPVAVLHGRGDLSGWLSSDRKRTEGSGYGVAHCPFGCRWMGQVGT